ncbi:MAG: hypothetical protein ACXITV_02925 [Luteibaculaceae bacterium]
MKKLGILFGFLLSISISFTVNGMDSPLLDILNSSECQNNAEIIFPESDESSNTNTPAEEHEQCESDEEVETVSIYIFPSLTDDTLVEKRTITFTLNGSLNFPGLNQFANRVFLSSFYPPDIK